MVLDAAFVASTVTSIMMNGVCCVWQMQEEEDRRDAIRQDIREEYERQRIIEQQIWEQRQSFYTSSQAGSETSLGSSVVASRREKLIVEKRSLSASRRQTVAEEERDSSCPSPSDGQVRARSPKKSTLFSELYYKVERTQDSDVEVRCPQKVDSAHANDNHNFSKPTVSLVDFDEDEETEGTEDETLDMSSDMDELVSLVDVAL